MTIALIVYVIIALFVFIGLEIWVAIEAINDSHCKPKHMPMIAIAAFSPVVIVVVVIAFIAELILGG